jgi:hypothetical protein
VKIAAAGGGSVGPDGVATGRNGSRRGVRISGRSYDRGAKIVGSSGWNRIGICPNVTAAGRDSGRRNVRPSRSLYKHEAGIVRRVEGSAIDILGASMDEGTVFGEGLMNRDTDERVQSISCHEEKEEREI